MACIAPPDAIDAICYRTSKQARGSRLVENVSINQSIKSSHKICHTHDGGHNRRERPHPSTTTHGGSKTARVHALHAQSTELYAYEKAVGCGRICGLVDAHDRVREL